MFLFLLGKELLNHPNVMFTYYIQYFLILLSVVDKANYIIFSSCKIGCEKQHLQSAQSHSVTLFFRGLNAAQHEIFLVTLLIEETREEKCYFLEMKYCHVFYIIFYFDPHPFKIILN